jgi:hypothetical protein
MNGSYSKTEIRVKCNSYKDVNSVYMRYVSDKIACNISGVFST